MIMDECNAVDNAGVGVEVQICGGVRHNLIMTGSESKYKSESTLLCSNNNVIGYQRVV